MDSLSEWACPCGDITIKSSDVYDASKFIGKKIINEMENERHNERYIDTETSAIVSREQLLFEFATNVTEFITKLKSYEDLEVPNIESINFPRIVLVGTQTSGKSSFINNLINMELMPTGDNMVTRSPVHIKVINNTTNSTDRVSIFTMTNGNKNLVYCADLNSTNTFNTLIFQKKMREATDMIAHKNCISEEPIIVEILTKDTNNNMSAKNLIIVDLPGLVTIPKTDIGQPASIVEDLKNLVMKEISHPNVYVLVAIQAKTDLETDVGLAVVKEIQRTNKSLKAIGLLTKLDLLDKRSLKQFDNNIFNPAVLSKSTALDGGFFVINNHNDNDEYYLNKNMFDKSLRFIQGNRFGSHNLMIQLKKNLITGIRAILPDFQKNLDILGKNVKIIVPQIGNSLEDKQAKMIYISCIYYILNKMFSDSFNATGNERNIGNDIRYIFDNFVQTMESLDPFNKTLLPDEKLQEIMDSFNGYVQSGENKTKLILKKCLADKETKPIQKLIEYVNICIQKLISLILKLADTLVDTKPFDIYPLGLNSYKKDITDFPKFREFILLHTTNILFKYQKEALDHITKYLGIQEQNSVWSYQHSDLSFKNEFEAELDNNLNNKKDSLNSKGRFESTMSIVDVRVLLRACYEHIVGICKEFTHKTAITTIINQFENKYLIEMLDETAKIDIDELFYETRFDINKKKTYENLLKDIAKLQEDINKLYTF
ncbi:putative dynamin-1-like protein [Bodo saltans virus]|uniref:Dynamin-1-like protein n=1 Tax=Bodo saltans virus TaxID=2024608 RepID=A0A2H4UUA8_9VIRU|nr:putative dynamin-1-like protein [Bodo saltans virus]ATZ80405.1 putative dynamin-1-like protein [Bodo saltans virus]